MPVMLRGIALVTIGLALAGCEQTRSVDYYKAHEMEARQTVSRCFANGKAGEDCGNASEALKAIERAKFDANREAAKAETTSGSWKPTWNGQ